MPFTGGSTLKSIQLPTSEQRALPSTKVKVGTDNTRPGAIEVGSGTVRYGLGSGSRAGAALATIVRVSNIARKSVPRTASTRESDGQGLMPNSEHLLSSPFFLYLQMQL
jgi:hypothetical protein